MSYDYAREIDDCRDQIDDVLEPSDYDDDTPRRPRYSCADHMCGATDCANCYPSHRGDEAEDHD